jgi:hypothetical protein
MLVRLGNSLTLLAAGSWPHDRGVREVRMGTVETGRAVLVVHVEVDEKDLDEVNRWYEEEHGPERMAMPGFLGMRRFKAFDGTPRLLAIYELEDADAATSPTYMSQQQSEWAKQVMATWKQWDRNVWVEISSAVRAEPTD